MKPTLALIVSTAFVGCFEFQDNPPLPDVQVVSPPDAGPGAPDAFVPPPRPDAAVQDESIITRFTAPTSIGLVTDYTLSWGSENMDSCTISSGVGDVAPQGTFTDQFTTPGQTSFTLDCAGPFGSDSRTLTITASETLRTGDVLIGSPLQLDSLSGINVVTGNLQILNAGITNTGVLESLVRIDGDLIVGNNPSLILLSLRNLERVGGNLFIDNNRAMTTIDFAALARIEERFYISRYDSLPGFAVNNLVQQLNSREGVGRDIIRYLNDSSAIMADPLQASFVCEIPQEGRFKLNLLSGVAALFRVQADGNIDTTPFDTGTYSFNPDVLRFIFDGGGAVETSFAIEFELDRLIAFRTAQLTCHSIGGFPIDASLPTGQYICPRILSNAQGAEQNNFTLRDNSGVEWLRTTEINGQTSIQETQFGTFVRDGSRIHFAFGGTVYHPKLSADLAGGQTTLLFDELEPGSGPCVKQ